MASAGTVKIKTTIGGTRSTSRLYTTLSGLKADSGIPTSSKMKIVDENEVEESQVIGNKSSNDAAVEDDSIGQVLRNCDIDSDGDGVNDCDDVCPHNNQRIIGDCDCEFAKSFSGICGCNDWDYDRDLDGVLDCLDECPDDPTKTKAGQCGCGVVDVDWDEDGIADCNDLCPRDKSKVTPGFCGCGEEDHVIAHFITLCDSSDPKMMIGGAVSFAFLVIFVIFASKFSKKQHNEIDNSHTNVTKTSL